MRQGHDYDANVTGLFYKGRTAKQTYFLDANFVSSNQYSNTGNTHGYSYNISLGKGSGNWTYGAGHGLESDNYNPNDMGFLFSPNEQYYYIEGGYANYAPKNPKLQLYRFSGFTNYSRLYNPNVFSDFSINLNSFVLFKSRFAFGINTRIEPIETYDYFEPRTQDFSRFLTWPKNYNLGGFISSDYRKPFAMDANVSFRYFDSDGRNNINLGVGPRFRFNDKFSLFASVNLSFIHQEPGWVNRYILTQPLIGLEDEDLLFGVRDRIIANNSISGSYIFNHLMGVNIRIRHYWDKVIYDTFGSLSSEGFVQPIDFNGQVDGQQIFDRNVNIFNIDLQYNWRFAPGSDIIVVWKNQIFNTDDAFMSDYFSNLGNLFGSAQTNSISLRVLYFLDYLYLKPNKSAPLM